MCESHFRHLDHLSASEVQRLLCSTGLHRQHLQHVLSCSPLAASPQHWETPLDLVALDTAGQEPDETVDTMEPVDAQDIKSTRGK